MRAYHFEAYGRGMRITLCPARHRRCRSRSLLHRDTCRTLSERIRIVNPETLTRPLFRCRLIIIVDIIIALLRGYYLAPENSRRRDYSCYTAYLLTLPFICQPVD